MFRLAALVLAVHAATSGFAAETTYTLQYVVDLTSTPARATVTVQQDERLLREVSFRAQPARWRPLEADGALEKGSRVVWSVPADGGSLTWEVTVDHQRSDQRFDARRTDDWALFRGEDFFPAMATRAAQGAESRATLLVRLPTDWSFITALAPAGERRFTIDNPARRFDRPTGWMLAGRRLGVRVEEIAGTKVYVAAPSHQGVRRQDMLALMNWVLPVLRRVLTDFPKRLVLVSANDPFWRGGLSGPNSLYLHADRPLISENGTSTLVHELFHVGFRRPAAADDDWIIEGLAEYYSVWLLHRSGTTTQQRFDKTLASLTAWSQDADGLRGPRSRGPVTARAAVLLHALNQEIIAETEGRHSLDHVVRRILADPAPVSLETLSNAAAQVLGRPARTLNAVPDRPTSSGQTSAGSR